MLENYRSIVIIIVCLLLCSCTKQAKKEAQPAKAVSTVSTPNTITIYCYDNFPQDKAEKLCRGIKQYFANVRVASKHIPLPIHYYNKERDRYLGTGLITDLSNYRNGDVVLGLTNRVIFEPNDKSPTFGIMGVSRTGTYKCIASSIIPASKKEQSDDIFLKLSLHELGHAFGLNHCADKHCFMIDAEHKMKFPDTPNFCANCKSKLNAKGWCIK